MTEWQHRAGWGLVAVVSLISVLSKWWPGSGSELIQLTSEQLQSLTAIQDDQYSDWLTKFDEQLRTDAASKQLLIVQAIPQEAPQVIGAISDADGDEENTHWRTPWPGVADALKSGTLAAPVLARSRHQGFEYQHHLIPFDETRSRCLLINEIAPAPKWSGLRALGLVLSSLLAVGLFFTEAPRRRWF